MCRHRLCRLACKGEKILHHAQNTCRNTVVFLEIFAWRARASTLLLLLLCLLVVRYCEKLESINQLFGVNDILLYTASLMMRFKTLCLNNQSDLRDYGYCFTFKKFCRQSSQTDMLHFFID